MSRALTKAEIKSLRAMLGDQPASDGRDLLKRLAEPFAAETVSWRVGPTAEGRGMALAYIDARDVEDRLDAVMGADWQDEYQAMPDGSYCCRIGLKIDGEWRWRSDGAVVIRANAKGNGEAVTQKDADAQEMVAKGTYSDAFKRAAVKWGIGRYLYSVPSPWVQINDRKQIVDTELPKLRSLLNRHAAAARAETGDKPAAQIQRTPEAGAANVAAVAQPSVSAAPAPASQQSAPQVAQEPPAQKGARAPSAHPLLVGDGKGREGLHVLQKKALTITQKAPQYTTRALKAAASKLDTAKAAWDGWHDTYPDITPNQEAEIEKSLAYYVKLRGQIDAAILGADPETGELPAEQEAA